MSMYLLRRRFRNRLRLRHRTRKLLVRVVVLLCLQLFLLTAIVVLVFRWVEPPTTAFMLQTQPRPGVVALEYQWVDRDDIAFDAFAAVLAAVPSLQRPKKFPKIIPIFTISEMGNSIH